jgi:hypothetical protein
MIEGFRVPDAVVLAYPVTLLCPVPSCSRLLSAVDPMLHTNVLMSLLPLYVGPEHDPCA